MGLPGRFLIAALIGLVAGLWTLTRPGDPALFPAPPNEAGATVYLIDNGFHTDLAVPRAALMDGGGPLAEATASLAPGDWVLVGWGDAKFYVDQSPVSGRLADGALELANPAPNWKGVGTVLDEREWDALGSWSAITATLPPPAPVEQPVYARPGDVGAGLLAWCAELGTEPAAPSTFLPLGRSPALIEELVCMDGSVLRWHLPTGKRWRYPAA